MTSTITKIRWYAWDKDILTVQSVTERVTEENYELTEIIRLGSVKYTFTNIDTKEKVNKIIEDIIDGKIK